MDAAENIQSTYVQKTKAPATVGIGRTSFERYIFPLIPDEKITRIGRSVLIDRLAIHEAVKQYKGDCTASQSNKRGKPCQKVTISTKKARRLSLISNSTAFDYMSALD